MFDADDTAQQQWQTALPAMKQQAERMSEMLQELLSLSRLETGEKELQNTSTDIAKLLEDIVQDAKQLKQYNDQNILLKIETEKWLLVDAEEIRSAISNLVINAVKYTPEKCDIVIRWAIENDKALIEVSDSGEGIAQYHLERLTERFYRVDSGRSQDVGGTGLGLAIVKHVLQRHDAELKISSDLGNGAIFSCYFPKSKIVEKPNV
jgi:two-component system phosphate regulon sensor histidine kinase PhoR